MDEFHNSLIVTKIDKTGYWFIGLMKVYADGLKMSSAQKYINN